MKKVKAWAIRSLKHKGKFLPFGARFAASMKTYSSERKAKAILKHQPWLMPAEVVAVEIRVPD